MNLTNLTNILPPPKTPHNTGNNQLWTKLEITLSTPLPQDYKKFLQTYGTGGIDNFLWILTPFVQDENVNFTKRMDSMSRAYLKLRKQFPQYYKHKIYPEPGGLLPWGYTDNGDELYWLTCGVPDEWTIVVYEARSSDYYEYALTMTEFLYKIIIGKLVCNAFPDDFPSEKPEFTAVHVE